MKKILVAVTGALLASPLTAMACDGSGGPCPCSTDGPTGALRMITSMLSAHVGMFTGLALGMAVLAFALSRRPEQHLAAQ